jgi:hypothetical protein
VWYLAPPVHRSRCTACAALHLSLTPAPRRQHAVESLGQVLRASAVCGRRWSQPVGTAAAALMLEVQHGLTRASCAPGGSGGFGMPAVEHSRSGSGSDSSTKEAHRQLSGGEEEEEEDDEDEEESASRSLPFPLVGGLRREVTRSTLREVRGILPPAPCCPAARVMPCGGCSVQCGGSGTSRDRTAHAVVGTILLTASSCSLRHPLHPP